MSEIDTIRSRLDDGDVTCEALIGFLLEFLSGELPPARARAFEEHLAQCSSCVAYLETYRTTIELARGAERAREMDPGAMPHDLVTAILAARG